MGRLSRNRYVVRCTRSVQRHSLRSDKPVSSEAPHALTLHANLVSYVPGARSSSSAPKCALERKGCAYSSSVSGAVQPARHGLPPPGIAADREDLAEAYRRGLEEKGLDFETRLLQQVRRHA
jgi:hypothetical protein